MHYRIPPGNHLGTQAAHKDLAGWSLECLNDWGQYIQYSIPGMFIKIAEVGTYEVGILVVGLTGSLQQGILVVLFYDYDIAYMVTSAHTFLRRIYIHIQ